MSKSIIRAALRFVAALGSAMYLGATCLPTQGPSQVIRGETVIIGDVKSIVIRAAHPKGSLVILTGGDGILNVSDGANFTGNVDNVLIRNRNAFVAQGLDTLLVEKGTNLADAIRFMAVRKRPVTVIATSAGTPRAAEGLVAGARPDRLILTSGFLDSASGPGKAVSSIVGSPLLLPQTLIIHHRHDACRFTSPNGLPHLWFGREGEQKWHGWTVVPKVKTRVGSIRTMASPVRIVSLWRLSPNLQSISFG